MKASLIIRRMFPGGAMLGSASSHWRANRFPLTEEQIIPRTGTSKLVRFETAYDGKKVVTG